MSIIQNWSGEWVADLVTDIKTPNGSPKVLVGKHDDSYFCAIFVNDHWTVVSYGIDVDSHDKAIELENHLKLMGKK